MCIYVPLSSVRLSSCSLECELKVNAKYSGLSQCSVLIWHWLDTWVAADWEREKKNAPEIPELRPNRILKWRKQRVLSRHGDFFGKISASFYEWLIRVTADGIVYQRKFDATWSQQRFRVYRSLMALENVFFCWWWGKSRTCFSRTPWKWTSGQNKYVAFVATYTLSHPIELMSGTSCSVWMETLK